MAQILSIGEPGYGGFRIGLQETNCYKVKGNGSESWTILRPASARAAQPQGKASISAAQVMLAMCLSRISGRSRR